MSNCIIILGLPELFLYKCVNVLLCVHTRGEKKWKWEWNQPVRVDLIMLIRMFFSWPEEACVALIFHEITNKQTISEQFHAWSNIFHIIYSQKGKGLLLFCLFWVETSAVVPSCILIIYIYFDRVDIEPGYILRGSRFEIVSRHTQSHLGSVRHDSGPLVHSE